jgi:hypothetical protein
MCSQADQIQTACSRPQPTRPFPTPKRLAMSRA